MLGSDASSIVQIGAGTVRLRVRGEKPRERPANPPGERPSKYSKWRVATLTSVYVLMGLHIAHWKLNGTTLAPLELNEVMYTLELGIVTAGFLFMLVALLATLIFGRFFCSWGCHIIALQDLCAWLLGKIRVRPRPVRSRVLLLVPPAALFYMFIWPQIARVIEGRAAPALHITTDQAGWSSFVTDDFWRNLPGPWVAGMTFLVCGFAIVWILGSRTFCQYACPYGALFAVADRLAPGRIKLTGQCEQCGHCTAICDSHVRVHEEIAKFGMVVDANCMKDLDCVGSCPHNAISFGFARPALLRSFSRTGRRAMRYDFTRLEEALMAAVFVAALFVFRGLYGFVPFLMSLGLGGILAYLAVLSLRLGRRPNVRFHKWQLRRDDRLTGRGQVFACVALWTAMLFVHSGFIRYHESRGARDYVAARQVAAPPSDLIDSAIRHLAISGRWGLHRPVSLHARLADLHLMRDAPGRAAPHLRALLERQPGDLDARLALARVYLVTDRPSEAGAEARRLLARLEEEPPATRGSDSHHAYLYANAHEVIAQLLERAGQYDEAVAHRLGAFAKPPTSTVNDRPEQ